MTVSGCVMLHDLKASIHSVILNTFFERARLLLWKAWRAFWGRPKPWVLFICLWFYCVNHSVAVDCQLKNRRIHTLLNCCANQIIIIDVDDKLKWMLLVNFMTSVCVFFSNISALFRIEIRNDFVCNISFTSQGIQAQKGTLEWYCFWGALQHSFNLIY